MATENLKELLKEGVTLDEQNVGQLTEMFEQAIVAERIKLTESKDAEIAALEARRDKTRARKQSMMQEFFAYRTRLVRRPCGPVTPHSSLKSASQP